MPPKPSAGAAYPRRATRSTARKSVFSPTRIKFSSTDPAPRSTDDETLPSPAADTSTQPPSAEVSDDGILLQNDVVMEISAEFVAASEERERENRRRAETFGVEGAAAAVASTETETLIEDKSEIELGENEGNETRGRLVVGDDEVVVPVTAALEGSSTVGGAAAEAAAVGGGGKTTKKVVRKVVKVVKKVVKKVPKRVVKGADVDGKGDDLMMKDAAALRSPFKNGEAPPSVSGMAAVEGSKDGMGVATVAVEARMETGIAENDGMEIEERRSSSLEEECNNSMIKMNTNEESLNDQTGRVSEEEVVTMGREDAKCDYSMKMNTKEDSFNAQLMRVEGQEATMECIYTDCDKSTEMSTKEDLLNDQPTRVEGEEVIVEQKVAINDDNVEHGNSNGEVGVDGGEDGRESEVEHSEIASKCEAEVGAGVYMSGEMKALERQRQRKTEIFVGGLNKDAKEEDIRKVFDGVGELVEVRLLIDSKTGKNKGYAFVRFASAAKAKRAAKEFSIVEICGKESGVSLVEGSDTLYLGSIDKKWKDKDVLKLLLGAGIEKIDKVTVIKDPNRNECNRGYAFVEFETSKYAQVAYNKLQKKDAFGINRTIKVAWADPLAEPDEEEMLKVKTVFAELVPSTWDEKKVRNIFKQFGEIENIVLSRDRQTSKRKDFAFISYETRDAAVACIDSFGSEFTDNDGTKVILKVSLAKPMSKGKHLKKVPKPPSREINNEKPKSSYGAVRQVDPRSQGRVVIPQHEIYGVQRPSTNAELVQLLREQAARNPLQNNLNSGYVDTNYSSSVSGRKRPFSSLEAGPLHPELRGHPGSYVGTSFPVAGPSYNSLPSPAGTISAPYYPHPGGYTSELHYGARAYVENETRKTPDGRSVLYRRY